MLNKLLTLRRCFRYLGWKFNRSLERKLGYCHRLAMLRRNRVKAALHGEGVASDSRWFIIGTTQGTLGISTKVWFSDRYHLIPGNNRQLLLRSLHFNRRFPCGVNTWMHFDLLFKILFLVDIFLDMWLQPRFIGHIHFVKLSICYLIGATSIARATHRCGYKYLDN